MADEKSVFDKQLEARAEWEKYQITGDLHHGEQALTAAESSGYANDGKSILLANVPELSAAYDKGVADNSTDYAIEKEVNRLSSHHLNQWGPMIPGLEGNTYEGPIVHGDDKSLYQASKIAHNEVLIRHDRSALHSSRASTLDPSHASVKIRYITGDYAVAAPSPEKELGGRGKDMGREK